MQDPNEDTEWNDILRQKGIIPPKEKEIDENDIVNMLEETITEKTKSGKEMGDMNLDELDEEEDELIDDEDQRILEQYRRQRLAEMKAAAEKSRFGDVREISKADWVTQVNEAGKDVYVLIHIYKQGMPMCALVEKHMRELAPKFPQMKFLRGEVNVCIPNYPDVNLPTLLLYCNGDLVKQWVGAIELSGNRLTADILEWELSQTGAITTNLKKNPRENSLEVDSKTGILLDRRTEEDDDDNDW